MTLPVYEEAHFLREGVVDINAAVVGLSRSSWQSIEEVNASKEMALELMGQKRFDILPIVNEAQVKEYYRTDTWSDFSSISKQAVTHRDVIPFHTQIRDVIKGFALENRNFFFLTSERRIVGLITVAHLNCRQTKVYLFSLLSELEVSLGNFISANIPEEELLQMAFEQKKAEKHEDVKKRFKEDKEAGVEVRFVEYLYLSDLIYIMVKSKLYQKLGYQSTYFKRSLGSLNELRNAIAHPARSIITDKHPVQKLWERIDRVEEALFVLGQRAKGLE